MTILAAINQQFGITNSIYFEGLNEYLSFDLDAQITGTTSDGADYLTLNTWQYRPDDQEDNDNKEWKIDKTLNFRSANNIEPCITYTFTLTNYALFSTIVQVYVEGLNYNVLQYSIIGQQVQGGEYANYITIAPGTTQQGTVGIIKVEIRPAKGTFEEVEEFKISLNINSYNE